MFRTKGLTALTALVLVTQACLSVSASDAGRSNDGAVASRGLRVLRKQGAAKGWACWPTRPPLYKPRFLGSLADQLRYRVCSTDSPAISVEIHPNFTGTTWRGFGTSASRMGEYLGSLPAPSLRCLTELLFSRSYGLGLTMLRFQIVGGYNAAAPPTPYSTSPFSDMGYHPQPWPSLQQRLGGYNWSADARQRRFLYAAKRAGVQQFQAISYSAPWWMLNSGDPSGGGWGGTNLKASHKQDFAVYLADVIQWFARSSRMPITFDYISPFNEAIEGWWTSGHSHEGCNFQMGDINDVVGLLATELLARQLSTKIAVADSWVGWTAGFFYWGLNDKSLAVVHHGEFHGYRHPSEQTPQRDLQDYSNVANAVAGRGKTLWQTEWGPKEVGSASEPDLAALLARSITQHINIARVEAWFYWLAIDSFNPYWGLLRMPYAYPPAALPRLQLTRQFYAMLHFTRFIPPGARPVYIAPACQHTVVAAFDPRKRMLSMIITNQRKQAKWVWLHVAGWRYRNPATPSCPATIIRSDPFHLFATVRSFAIKLPSYVPVYVAPESVTTLLVRNVLPPLRKKPLRRG